MRVIMFSIKNFSRTKAGRDDLQCILIIQTNLASRKRLRKRETSSYLRIFGGISSRGFAAPTQPPHGGRSGRRVQELAGQRGSRFDSIYFYAAPGRCRCQPLPRLPATLCLSPDPRSEVGPAGPRRARRAKAARSRWPSTPRTWPARTARPRRMASGPASCVLPLQTPPRAPAHLSARSQPVGEGRGVRDAEEERLEKEGVQRRLRPPPSCAQAQWQLPQAGGGNMAE